jgi:hypothetical protein
MSRIGKRIHNFSDMGGKSFHIKRNQNYVGLLNIFSKQEEKRVS